MDQETGDERQTLRAQQTEAQTQQQSMLRNKNKHLTRRGTEKSFKI
jgi:hypothetical protein